MQEIQLGRVYRHFKGDYYLVEAVAHDSETARRASSTASSTAMAGYGCAPCPCF